MSPNARRIKEVADGSLGEAFYPLLREVARNLSCLNLFFTHFFLAFWQFSYFGLILRALLAQDKLSFEMHPQLPLLDDSANEGAY